MNTAKPLYLLPLHDCYNINAKRTRGKRCGMGQIFWTSVPLPAVGGCRMNLTIKKDYDL